jgi:hypothetical protein
MRSSLRSRRALGFLGAACAAAVGGFAASPPANGPKPLTFDNGRGTFEFVERLRYEDRRENFDFDSAAHSPTDDTWFVQRVRFGATWKPNAGLATQFQFQDAREWSSERPNVPFILGAEGDDALDLRLASLTFGDPKKDAAVFTVGRQTLVLGEERLVGIGEWNNFARTFDAAKAVWSLPRQTTLTVFASSVVTIRPTTSGEGWQANHSSTDDLFFGAQVAQRRSSGDTLEGYLLWRDKRDNDPIYSAPAAAIPVAARTAAAYDIGQNVATLGARWLRAPKADAFDAELEAAWQWGEVNRQTTAAVGPYAGSAPTLDHRAWAVHALVGYTPLAGPGKLRIDFEYNVASGDTNRTDGENGSFMILFPSNHKWYGFMDVFAWKNLREAVATLRFNPVPTVAARVDYHVFSLYSTQDAWYRANGVATVRPLSLAAQSAPHKAGDELDATLTWTPKPWATVDLGWSRFFAGPYLGATGARSDANFVYAQTTLKF